jgi:hypothetical protein
MKKGGAAPRQKEEERKTKREIEKEESERGEAGRRDKRP